MPQIRVTEDFSEATECTHLFTGRRNHMGWSVATIYIGKEVEVEGRGRDHLYDPDPICLPSGGEPGIPGLMERVLLAKPPMARGLPPQDPPDNQATYPHPGEVWIPDRRTGRPLLLAALPSLA